MEELNQVNRRVKHLHKAHVHLKMDVLRNIGSVNNVIKEAMKAAAQLSSSDIGSQQELEEVRALYQKEALQRRLLYNQLQVTLTFIDLLNRKCVLEILRWLMHSASMV